MLWLLLLGWLAVALLVGPALGRLLASRSGLLVPSDTRSASPVDTPVDTSV